MTRLPFSEELYQLLRRVNEGFVFHHDLAETHAPGWSWQASDMSLSFQELCAEANHARLLHIGLHNPWGSAVSLTGDGETRLKELRDRHNAEARGVA